MTKLVCIRGHILAETRRKSPTSGASRCYKCETERHRARWKNKPWARNQRLKRKYGINELIWEATFKQQGEVCAICKTDTTKQWHTDHNHITGKFRGILCASCNHNLGGYETIITYDTLQDYLN